MHQFIHYLPVYSAGRVWFVFKYDKKLYDCHIVDFFFPSLVTKIASISSPEPKAEWWAYRIGRPLSSVCMYVCSMSTFSNIFSSETTGPIKVKFHMEPPRDGGMKVHSTGQDHMAKMAAMPMYGTAMPMYGKNLKKSSQKPKGRWPWNLVCSIGCLSTTKFVQMMTLGWPWPIFRQDEVWSLMLLYGKKVKQWIFQKLLKSTMSKSVDAVN